MLIKIKEVGQWEQLVILALPLLFYGNYVYSMVSVVTMHIHMYTRKTWLYTLMPLQHFMCTLLVDTHACCEIKSEMACVLS